MSETIQLIPIDQIHIENPRVRDKTKFEKIVRSIRVLGLKKPITLSRRLAAAGEEPVYELVCGQGRIEAFLALDYKEIPAVVIEASKEDRLLMSLVENLARRLPATMDLVNEIERLKKEGYTVDVISKKLDMSKEYVGGILALKKSGEERILNALVKDIVPVSVALELAKVDGLDAQRALLTAYENKQLNHKSLRSLRRLIEKRHYSGKSMSNGHKGKKAPRASADGLVSAYRKQCQKQRAMIKRAKVMEARLIFVVGAMQRLLKDENYVTLLRAEQLDTLPEDLAKQINPKPEDME